MLSAKENERLTRVARGTPMGEFLCRRDGGLAALGVVMTAYLFAQRP
jgi:hypothetical protein